MSYKEGRCCGSGPPPLPPSSNRTLHHPSFQALYTAAHLSPEMVPEPDCNAQTEPVHPIIREDFFYCDPTVSSGRRIPNAVSGLMVFDCFRLNTPRPVMSARVAPPTCPDPFGYGPHPTRDLGSLALRTNTLHPPVRPNRVVLQLTQEEDQAITHLLELRHQEPARRDESLGAERVDANPVPSLDHPEPMDSTSAEDGRASRRKGSEALPASLTADCAQNEDDRVGRTPGELLESWCADYLSVCQEYLAISPSRVSRARSRTRASLDSEVKERPLSDSEEDAAFGLLNLGDTGVLEATPGSPETI